MRRYLFAFDFDRTIADTFQIPPHGMGVKEADQRSVEDIFGLEGLDKYEVIGGLGNKAPSELVHALLLGDNSHTLIQNAYKFYKKNREKLEGFVPEDKGLSLIWDETSPERIIGEILARQKLSYLLPQIGLEMPEGIKWPRLINGFSEFWQRLGELKKEIGLDTAIISLGHDLFIRRTFKLWGLEPPDIIVSEDDIRGKKYPQEVARRVKPGKLQIALAHQEWLKRQELGGVKFTLDNARSTREGMIYFGDDPNKDGGLTRYASQDMEVSYIPFGLVIEGSDLDLDRETRKFSFGEWRQIANILDENKHLLKESRPLDEIFFYQPNRIEGRPIGPEK